MKKHLINFKLLCALFILLICGRNFAQVGNNGISPLIALPKLGGKYSVGVKNLYFTDKSRTDSTGFREVAAHVWYPAENAGNLITSKYLAVSEEAYNSSGKFIASIANFEMPVQYFQMQSLIKTNSFKDVKISNAERNYPVLIFLHGLGAPAAQSSAQMEELASNGYIVFSLEFANLTPFLINDDGKVVCNSADNDEFKSLVNEFYRDTINLNIINKMVQTNDIQRKKDLIQESYSRLPHSIKSIRNIALDVTFLIDKIQELNKTDKFFKGKFDLTKIGTFGHSLGASVAAQASLSDKRIKAVVNIDGPLTGDFLKSQLSVPMLFIYGDDGNALGWNDYFWKNMKCEAYRLHIKGAQHLSFTDAIIFPGSTNMKAMFGELEANRCIKIQKDFILAFFDKYLKQVSNNLINKPTNQYPEVEILKNDGK